jgi:hypothetical protein
MFPRTPQKTSSARTQKRKRAEQKIFPPTPQKTPSARTQNRKRAEQKFVPRTPQKTPSARTQNRKPRVVENTSARTQNRKRAELKIYPRTPQNAPSARTQNRKPHGAEIYPRAPNVCQPRIVENASPRAPDKQITHTQKKLTSRRHIPSIHTPPLKAQVSRRQSIRATRAQYTKPCACKTKSARTGMTCDFHS